MLSPAPNERLLGGTRYLLFPVPRKRPLSTSYAATSWALWRFKPKKPTTAEVDLDHSSLRQMDGFFLRPRRRAPRRRGYSHWSSAMVNAQHDNSFHFSVRNGSRILETSSNSGIEAHFALPGSRLHFCIVRGSYSTGFAMQNVLSGFGCVYQSFCLGTSGNGTE